MRAMFITIAILLAPYVDADAQYYTYCTNGTEVIIVTDYTCPPGYWRTD